jgi:hypothetical protein
MAKLVAERKRLLERLRGLDEQRHGALMRSLGIVEVRTPKRTRRPYSATRSSYGLVPKSRGRPVDGSAEQDRLPRGGGVHIRDFLSRASEIDMDKAAHSNAFDLETILLAAIDSIERSAKIAVGGIEDNREAAERYDLRRRAIDKEQKKLRLALKALVGG